jgi:hypothetical protein
MARLKLPANVTGVAYGAHQFEADGHGIVDTKDAPDSVVKAIIQNTRARYATDEDMAAAEVADAEAGAVATLGNEKDILLGKLKELGVTDVDGRKSVAYLRKRVAAAEEAADAANAPIGDVTIKKPAAK